MINAILYHSNSLPAHGPIINDICGTTPDTRTLRYIYNEYTIVKYSIIY